MDILIPATSLGSLPATEFRILDQSREPKEMLLVDCYLKPIADFCAKGKMTIKGEVLRSEIDRDLSVVPCGIQTLHKYRTAFGLDSKPVWAFGTTFYPQSLAPFPVVRGDKTVEIKLEEQVYVQGFNGSDTFCSISLNKIFLAREYVLLTKHLR